VTAYVNGSANEVWVDNPKESRFFEHAYRAWQQGQLADITESNPERMSIFRRISIIDFPSMNPLKRKLSNGHPIASYGWKPIRSPRLRPPIR